MHPVQYDWCSWIPNAPSTMRQPPPNQKGLADVNLIVDSLPDRGRSSWHLGAVWALSQYQESEVPRTCACLQLICFFAIRTNSLLCFHSYSWACILMNTSLRSQLRQPWSGSGSSSLRYLPLSREETREKSFLTITCPLIKSPTALLYKY